MSLFLICGLKKMIQNISNFFNSKLLIDLIFSRQPPNLKKCIVVGGIVQFRVDFELQKVKGIKSILNVK